MTAEFPDMSLTELEARRALAQEELLEFAEMSLTDLRDEFTRREKELEALRDLYLPAYFRVVDRRLASLKAEMARRQQP